MKLDDINITVFEVPVKLSVNVVTFSSNIPATSS